MIRPTSLPACIWCDLSHLLSHHWIGLTNLSVPSKMFWHMGLAVQIARNRIIGQSNIESHNSLRIIWHWTAGRGLNMSNNYNPPLYNFLSLCTYWTGFFSEIPCCQLKFQSKAMDTIRHCTTWSSQNISDYHPANTFNIKLYMFEWPPIILWRGIHVLLTRLDASSKTQSRYLVSYSSGINYSRFVVCQGLRRR